MSSLDQTALANLDDASKKDIMAFLESENSKQKVQMSIHNFTNMCFKNCVPNIQGGDLSSTEEQCLNNCLNRFLDTNIKIVNGLQTMQG